MKKLINNPNNVVEEMLEGFVMSYPLVKKIKDYNIIIRNNFKFLNVIYIYIIYKKKILKLFCFYRK